MLSSNEWQQAQRLHQVDEGDRYAVLVVRRTLVGAVPAEMHLLVDPVGLVREGQLRKDDDGYRIGHRVAAQPQS